MKFYLKTFLLLPSIFIFSCGQKKNKPIKNKIDIKWDKRKQLDTLNQIATLQLSNKYNALVLTYRD